MNPDLHVRDLSDDELLLRTTEVAAEGRRIEALLIAHLAEVEARKLHLREACPSMFVYATERLHLSEAQAYDRIGVARTARAFPRVLEMMAEGLLTLTTASLLGPHLTAANVDEVLRRASGGSKREIQILVAELAPRPDVPPVLRKLPEPRPRPTASAPAELLPAAVSLPPPAPAVLVPIAPARFKVQFTAGAELEAKIARARALLRHAIPSGDHHEGGTFGHDRRSRDHPPPGRPRAHALRQDRTAAPELSCDHWLAACSRRGQAGGLGAGPLWTRRAAAAPRASGSRSTTSSRSRGAGRPPWRT